MNQHSNVGSNINMTSFLTPSVSPIYSNNPSFTIVDLVDFKINLVNTWSFLLTEYTLFGSKRWNEINWTTKFGVDFNNSDKIRSFY